MRQASIAKEATMFRVQDKDPYFRPDMRLSNPTETGSEDGWDFDDWGFEADGVDMVERAAWPRRAPRTRGVPAGTLAEDEPAGDAGVTLHDAICHLLELDWY